MTRFSDTLTSKLFMLLEAEDTRRLGGWKRPTNIDKGMLAWYNRPKDIAETHASHEERFDAIISRFTGEASPKELGLAQQESIWRWQNVQKKLLRELLADISHSPNGSGISRENIISSQIRQWIDDKGTIDLNSTVGFFVPLEHTEKFLPSEPIDAPKIGGKLAGGGVERTFQPKAGEKGATYGALKRVPESGAGAARREIRRVSDSETGGMNIDLNRAVKLSTGTLDILKEYLKYRFAISGMPHGPATEEGEAQIGRIDDPYPISPYDAMFVDSENKTMQGAMNQVSEKVGKPGEQHVSAHGRVLFRDGNTAYMLPIKDDNGDLLIERGDLQDMARRTITRRTPEGTEELLWKHNGKPVIVGALLSDIGDKASRDAKGKAGVELDEKQETNFLSEKWSDLEASATRSLKLITMIMTNGEVKPWDPKFGGDAFDMFYAMSSLLDIKIEELFEMNLRDIRTPHRNDEERFAYFKIGGKEYPLGLTLEKEQEVYPGVPGGATEALLQELQTYQSLRGVGREARVVSDRLWYPFGFQTQETPKSLSRVERGALGRTPEQASPEEVEELRQQSGSKRELRDFRNYFDRRILGKLKKRGGAAELNWVPIQLISKPQFRSGSREPQDLADYERSPYDLKTSWVTRADANVLQRPKKQEDVEEDTSTKQAEALASLYESIKEKFEDVLEDEEIRKVVERIDLSDIAKKEVSAVKGTKDLVLSIKPFMPFMDRLEDLGVIATTGEPAQYSSLEPGIIRPHDEKMANIIAPGGYSEVDPDKAVNQVYGLTIEIPDHTQKALSTWLKVRGDSSNTNRMFWMSLDNEENEKMSEGRAALKNQIDASIVRDLKTDESRDSTIAIGDWRGNVGEENDIRAASQFVVLDVLEKTGGKWRDLIPSPVEQRHLFNEHTTDWEAEGHEITNISHTWPPEVQTWLKDAATEGDRRAKMSQYKDWLKARERGARTIKSKRFGDVLLRKKKPLETFVGKVEIEISDIEAVKDSLLNIKTAGERLDILNREIQKIDTGLKDPERVSKSADELQALRGDLTDLHGQIDSISGTANKWEHIIDTVYGEASGQLSTRSNVMMLRVKELEEKAENILKRATDTDKEAERASAEAEKVSAEAKAETDKKKKKEKLAQAKSLRSEANVLRRKVDVAKEQADAVTAKAKTARGKAEKLEAEVDKTKTEAGKVIKDLEERFEVIKVFGMARYALTHISKHASEIPERRKEGKRATEYASKILKVREEQLFTDFDRTLGDLKEAIRVWGDMTADAIRDWWRNELIDINVATHETWEEDE